MKKIIFLIILLIISFCMYINVNADVVIPDDAIRVRVVPNSNSVVDQNMKIIVKDYVSNYMAVKLRGVDDVDKAREIISSNLDDLNNNIRGLFEENNYDMDYKINYGNNYFPDKSYKGIIYNEGNYESLVVYIGESSGDNWWCVLFPPLCLLEADESDTGEIEYKSLVAEMLDRIF